MNLPKALNSYPSGITTYPMHIDQTNAYLTNDNRGRYQTSTSLEDMVVNEG